MKIIKILYDISILTHRNDNDSSRSGLYHCAENVMRQLVKRTDVELLFYCDPKYLGKYKDAISIYSDEKPVNYNSMLYKLSMVRYWFLKQRDNAKQKNNIIKRKLCTGIIRIIDNVILPYFNGISNEIIYDWYFSPHDRIPQFVHKNKNIRKAQILHDAIPLIYPEAYNTTWTKNIISDFDHKNLYFANSENTKKDYLQFAGGFDSNRIRVVYHACNHRFQKKITEEDIERIREKYIIDDKSYIFSLCSVAPNKNLIRIVKTFIEFVSQNNIDNLVMLMGGATWDHPFTYKFQKEVGKMEGFRKYVKMIGYVDDVDLPALYHCASFFVYTSQYEGFGVPPLEAMSCGCPVIVSNSSSIPEVVGDAGIKIKWDSDEEHIAAYEKYYYDSEYKELMRQKGLVQAQKFSWTKTVNEIVRYMKKDMGLRED